MERTLKIIGQSPALTSLLSQVQKIARTNINILLMGESGTGKGMIAREIHWKSPRAHHPFVTINCGAMPETLLESELFGHKRGAFTGAIADKAGLFQVAEKGTFFLDEIGETSLATQVKLLRVIDEKEILPLGKTEPHKVDVRIIAATNKDLSSEIEKRTFREDLFYRLNVISMTVPSLRERKEDIPLLVDHFLQRACRHLEIPAKKISPEILEILVAYDWPGNVRELENAIERLCVLVEGEEIQDKSDLEKKLLQGTQERGGQAYFLDEGLSKKIEGTLDRLFPRSDELKFQISLFLVKHPQDFFSREQFSKEIPREVCGTIHNVKKILKRMKDAGLLSAGLRGLYRLNRDRF